jgi:hypothetical protein
MSDSFEAKKNTQASMLTLGVAGVLLLILILVKFDFPTISIPVFNDVMEVNLGSSDFGSGKDQPRLPGEPAPAKQLAYVPPTSVKSIADNVKDVETDEKNVDAAPIKKPTVTKPNATKIDNDNKTVKTNPKPQTVIAQTPPRPKAVLGRTLGGNGNGGNGAETYQKGSNEGITTGNGDQGKPGGDPNGKNYTGTPRNRGVQVVQIPSQSFEDEFNQNGKVAMDILVDDNGRLISANFQPAQSTTRDNKMIEIARRRAGEIKYPKYEGGFKQVLIFEFKLRG